MKGDTVLNTEDRHLMDTKTTSEYLGVRSQLLAQWRYAGTGPAFYRLGRAVKYDLVDLDAWLAEAKVAHHR